MDGKHKALRHLFGDFCQSYTELPRFLLTLKESNLKYVIIRKTFYSNMQNTEIFQRMFWSFKPSIEAFELCRLVLSIDCTCLYRKYKGALMIVIVCDGNNQLFLLVFAIIEDENINSWGWFLACIRNIERTGICVISDRHPGIMAAMSDPHLS